MGNLLGGADRAAIPTSAWVRGAKVSTIFRTDREDKVQIDVMKGDGTYADQAGGGALLLNLQADHGLNPGDLLMVMVWCG